MPRYIVILLQSVSLRVAPKTVIMNFLPVAKCLVIVDYQDTGSAGNPKNRVLCDAV